MEIGWDHLGGPVEHSEGKDRESVVAILRFLCGSPCLCRLRIEGLIPVSKYWTYRSHAGDYGPSKPSSWLPTYALLCSHCFIGWLGRETGYGPVDRSAGVLWIVSGALFSGTVALLNSVGDCVKGCHIRGLPVGSVRRAYMGWRRKRTCRVGRVAKNSQLLDMQGYKGFIWLSENND
jgi:hypothetical protein